MTLDMGFLSTVDKIASSLPQQLQFLVFQPPFRKIAAFLEKISLKPSHGAN